MNSKDARTKLKNAMPEHVACKLQVKYFASSTNATDIESSWFFSFPDYAVRRLMAVRRGYWAMLSAKAAETDGPKIPCVVVACDDDAYVVQVLATPGKTGSFVEATLRPADALYSYIHEKVGMLNLAGPEEFIEGLGENFGKRHYNIYISDEQHQSIVNSKA